MATDCSIDPIGAPHLKQNITMPTATDCAAHPLAVRKVFPPTGGRRRYAHYKHPDIARKQVKALLLLLAATTAAASDTQWPANGGSPYNIRYSPLTQVTAANVGKLQVAWVYDAHDAFKDSEMQSNPIVVDGTLYATTPTLQVVALDARTGH